MKANPLSHEEVYALACSANRLAAKHIRKPHRWSWLWGDKGSDALRSCDQCHRVWVSGMDPRHADYCPVGRTIERALAIIALGPVHLPSRDRAESQLLRRDLLLPPPQAEELRERIVDCLEFLKTLSISNPLRAEGWRRAIEAALRMPALAPPDELRITEVPSHERSDANGSMAGSRAGEDLSGRHPGEYKEPWAWHPELGVVVDRAGNTVANLLLTDLEPWEQKDFGKRIAACVNFFKGDSNELLRKAQDAVDAEELEAAALGRVR